MTRRYYRIRSLEAVEQRLVEGVPFVLSAYEHEGERFRVAATVADPDDLGAALRALAACAREIPEGERLLADVYLLRAGEEDLAGARRRGGAAGGRGPRRVRARSRGRRAHVRAPTARSAPSSAACTRCSPSGWTSGACASSRSSACPRRRTSTCSAPRRATTRRTSAWSRSPRSATSRRCATSTAASPRCRSSSGWCARRSRRCARSSRAARRATACTGTGCCSTPGRRSTSSPPRRARSSTASRA